PGRRTTRVPARRRAARPGRERGGGSRDGSWKRDHTPGASPRSRCRVAPGRTVPADSGADVTIVESPGPRLVRGPGDDGAAVGEDRQRALVDGRAQEPGVPRDGTE